MKVQISWSAASADFRWQIPLSINIKIEVKKYRNTNWRNTEMFWKSGGCWLSPATAGILLLLQASPPCLQHHHHHCDRHNYHHHHSHHPLRIHCYHQYRLPGSNIIIIIITRPRPAFGQLGLGKSLGGKTSGLFLRLASRLRRSARLWSNIYWLFSVDHYIHDNHNHHDMLKL